MTQKQTIVEHLKSGKSITQLEATLKYQIMRLAPIIHELKNKDKLPVKSRDKLAKGSGKPYSEYYLEGQGERDDSPGLFSELDPPIQMSDSLDISDTPLKPVEQARDEKIKPPEVSGKEVRAHHVANPGDQTQILASFRAYCEQFGGKPVEITPDWARQLLKLNRDQPQSPESDHIRNRDITSKKRRENVESFKKALRENTFFHTNIGIGFDWDGFLVDGQTRLTACLESGISFFINVTFDMDPKAFAVIDNPDSARTTADLAYMFGINENGPATVAAVSLLYRKEHGLGHTEKLKPKQVIEALRKYDDIGPSVKLAKSFKMVRAPKAVIAGVHYLASKVNKAVADKTFDDFITGVNTGIDDPVLVARERLRRSYGQPGNEFRGAGDRKVRVMLSRMFNYRLNNVRTTKYILDGGDDWPGDVVKGKKAQ